MLTKHNFAIGKLASKEFGRFTRPEILVTPTETVVTDGHQLTIVSGDKDIVSESFPVVQGALIPQDQFAPFTMSSETAKLIEQKLSSHKTSLPILKCAAVAEFPDGGYQVTVTDLNAPLTVAVPKSDHQFPDYPRVIPKEESFKYKFSFDANLVIPILKEMQAFAEKGKNTNGKVVVEVSVNENSNSPFRFQTKNAAGQQWTSIVMPIAQEISCQIENVGYKRYGQSYVPPVEQQVVDEVSEE